MIEIRLKIIAKKSRIEQRGRRLDISRLKNDHIGESFILQLLNRYDVLTNRGCEPEDSEEAWIESKRFT